MRSKTYLINVKLHGINNKFTRGGESKKTNLSPNLAQNVLDSLNTSSWECISCLVRRQRKGWWFCIARVLYASSYSALTP